MSEYEWMNEGGRVSEIKGNMRGRVNEIMDEYDRGWVRDINININMRRREGEKEREGENVNMLVWECI